MIARIWRGVVRPDDADEDAHYIRDTGFTEYAETFRRDLLAGCSASHQALAPRPAAQIGSSG